MNNPFDLSEHQYTDEDIAVIQEANELDDVRRMAGYKRIDDFMAGLVSVAQNALASVDTTHHEAVLDAVREYQAKHDFHNQIKLYIDSAIQQREALAPRNQLERLLLQEHINAGRSSNTDNDADAAG